MGFTQVFVTENAQSSPCLDDYAFYVTALIELYNSTLDKNYLEKAEAFCNETVRRFMYDKNGGFFLSAPNSTELFINPKETYDGAIPSGNSVMAYNLVRLYQITEKDEYNELFEKQIAFIANVSVVTDNAKYPLLNNQTTFYVCKNRNCLPPTNDICTALPIPF